MSNAAQRVTRFSLRPGVFRFTAPYTDCFFPLSLFICLPIALGLLPGDSCCICLTLSILNYLILIPRFLFPSLYELVDLCHESSTCWIVLLALHPQGKGEHVPVFASINDAMGIYPFIQGFSRELKNSCEGTFLLGRVNTDIRTPFSVTSSAHRGPSFLAYIFHMATRFIKSLSAVASVPYT